MNDDPNLNPLLNRPIIIFNDKYYFLLPSAQLSAVNEFILRIIRERGLEEEVMFLFHERIWQEVWQGCSEMNWLLTDISIPLQDKLPIRERIFQFDINRFAYVCYVNDPNTKSEGVQDSGERIKNSMQFSDALNERISDVIKDLQNRPCFWKANFLLCFWLGGTSDMFALGIDPPSENEERIWFTVFDFLALALNKEWNHLGLWKFAKSFKAISKTIRFQFFSTLDLYAIYKSKSESFYFSDDKKPTHITIAPT